MTKKTSSKSILVVEDDPTYLKLWEKMLPDLGISRFWPTATSEEALKVLQKNKIDILISDVVMPGLNGYGLAKAAKKKNPKVEILLTTGYQTDLSRFDLKHLRCHLLHKPYHNLNDVCALLIRLIKGENPFSGADEDSFSDNVDYPEVTEWTL